MRPQLIEQLEKCQQGAELLHSNMHELYSALCKENPLAAELFLTTGLKMASELDNLLDRLSAQICT